MWLMRRKPGRGCEEKKIEKKKVKGRCNVNKRRKVKEGMRDVFS